jgi:hypothetical protein
MTRSLDGVERLFERLLEGPTARLFRTQVQPAQLVRRIEREMDAGRVDEADRTYAPHRYRVLLHVDDMAAFEQDRDGLEAMLAEEAVRRAQRRGYRLIGTPSITVVPSGQVARGEVRVVAEALDPGRVHAAATGLRQVAPDPPRDTDLAQAATAAAPIRALIEVRPHTGEPWSVQFQGNAMRVGRGPHNEVALDDPRVSRVHGELIERRGTLVYVDLDSSNGSFVNGTRQREIALGAGDVIRVGRSTLTIRSTH